MNGLLVIVIALGFAVFCVSLAALADFYDEDDE